MAETQFCKDCAHVLELFWGASVAQCRVSWQKDKSSVVGGQVKRKHHYCEHERGMWEVPPNPSPTCPNFKHKARRRWWLLGFRRA